MNRKIKFRAWDKEDCAMRTVLGFSLYHGAVSVDIGNGRYLQDDSSRFDLMQYTGLLDKNGAEIYEGDVVKGTAIQFEGGLDYFGEVEFITQNTAYGLQVTEPMRNGVAGGWSINQLRTRISLDHITGEVIGNIYENPELLEEETE